MEKCFLWLLIKMLNKNIAIILFFYINETCGEIQSLVR